MTPLFYSTALKHHGPFVCYSLPLVLFSNFCLPVFFKCLFKYHFLRDAFFASLYKMAVHVQIVIPCYPYISLTLCRWSHSDKTVILLLLVLFSLSYTRLQVL